MFCNSLKSKKGFTLVELMIVVVIMGILVAVAVPVYNAVTKNAKKNTCHSNCEILEKAAVQCMSANGVETIDEIANEGVTFDATHPIFIASESDYHSKLSEKYIQNIDDPPKIFDSDCEYSIYYENNGKSVHVYCSVHGDKIGQTHS